ncbi:uncharacterized protein LOC113370381 [Ctenocephalides felis]|uniref:uncharacterized protein LOC113370381 n=1 Tax=Ctenocephalides felis TaxID=7515 RepID=UPI000E6E45DD|nr:uncharacterized protein LOC113370381 [Ctenocephalides felis]
MNEIRQLNDLIRQKEQEWNELVYLQKAKEELLIRLSRKRDVMLMRMKVDDGHNTSSDLNDLTMLNSNCSNNAVSLTNILSKSMFPNYFSNAASVNGEVTNKIEPQVNHFANNVHNGVTVLPVNYSGSNFQAKIQLPPQAHSNNIIKNGPMNHFNNLGNINHNQFMLNQQLNSPINGRQGLVKDVKSIIADYRQQHPEVVPKRGRRMKSVLQSNNVGIADGPNDANRLSELGLLLANNEMGSRPSSSESNDNMLLRNQHFQLNSDNGIPLSLMNDISRTSDISLHPINGNLEDTGKQQSLLHGILSKKSQRTTTSTSDSNAYTSTLARLLTAPERNSSNTSINHLPSTLAERLGGNISNRKTMTVTNERSKRRCTDEVTITPIDNRPAVESNEVKEEPKDSGEHHIEININGESAVTEENGDEEEETPPPCQGCNKSEAHYVCAGCANQWYCSRECQVNAWEVHSEVCKG